MIIAIEDHRREACWQEEEHRRCADDDVNMLGASSPQNSKRKANANPEPKPRTKKPKITPAFAPHKPGSDAALALLTQVDTTLEAVQLADDGDQVPRAELQKHRDAIDQAAQRQLYLLDIALQNFRTISDRRTCLDKALGPTEVDHAGSLLDVLNVSFDMRSPTFFSPACYLTHLTSPATRYLTILTSNFRTLLQLRPKTPWLFRKLPKCKHRLCLCLT
ncbi:hypothetical protein C0993_001070 [Termitomyces sp. T159_Od127]|nr:hypothetical protein C0993_001070 [Termitomyces sp. T159_Od127]